MIKINDVAVSTLVKLNEANAYFIHSFTIACISVKYYLPKIW